MRVLNLRELSLTFNPQTPLENKVIRSLNLTVRQGDFITLLGSNGAGKSTLLNLISGAYLPDEGEILLEGRDITGLKAHQRAPFIGRVHQDPRLSVSPNMTLLENLSLADAKGSSFSLKRAIDLKRVQDYRDHLKSLGLGLEDKLNTRIGLLSGGQRQAVALYMAIMKRPKLLLLDEHTAALDPKTSELIMKVTDDLIREEKLTSLMVTHNMQHALKYGNRLIMMHEGTIVEDIRGQEKVSLTAEDVIRMFKTKGDALDDRLVLGM